MIPPDKSPRYRDCDSSLPELNSGEIGCVRAMMLEVYALPASQGFREPVLEMRLLYLRENLAAT